NYGIHGTNRPESISGYVSNGCIRMTERDVEELFDAVEVGTPVEITYNRVVVEKNPNDDVVYYIYPDGYGMQDISVEDVAKWLEPFGVLPFESEYDISQKIEASDGEPTFIGKPYNVEVNGELAQPTDANNTRYFAKAVLRDGISYLPVVPIAKILRMRLEWNKTEASLKSRFGKVICYDRKGQLYCNADDAIVLFHIEGGLQTGVGGQKLFRFNSVKETAPPVEKPKETKKPKKTKTDVEKPFEEPKADEPTKESKPAEETSEPAEKSQAEDKPQAEEKVQPQEKVRPVEEDSIRQPETAEEASA
ncbi:MAG: L,D-transpeptidase family protein, partial [Selenomonadaceae bacterium]|nr:L,D-transpeptidase family protein [Selenomonadaceae bacterium]